MAARYLLRDRDSIYGNDVRLRIASLGTKESSHCPAQSVAESIRRTPDRLHPPGVPEPLHDPECETYKEYEEDAEKLSPLLS